MDIKATFMLQRLQRTAVGIWYTAAQWSAYSFYNFVRYFNKESITNFALQSFELQPPPLTLPIHKLQHVKVKVKMNVQIISRRASMTVLQILYWFIHCGLYNLCA
jgi:hypothetical protein